MKYQVHDRVVLRRDIPAKGLRAGDVGVVADCLDPGGLALEFFNALGDTTAVVVTGIEDVRPLAETDMPAVRDLAPSHL